MQNTSEEGRQQSMPSSVCEWILRQSLHRQTDRRNVLAHRTSAERQCRDWWLVILVAARKRGKNTARGTKDEGNRRKYNFKMAATVCTFMPSYTST
jgi:hypothetical protein